MPQCHDTKLILITSAGNHGYSDAVKTTLNAILDKPVRQKDLLGCLARVLAAPILPKAVAVDTKVAASNADLSTSLLPPLRVLLAEDNKINQTFALALLKKVGYHVDVAENGHQAVDAVRRANYDVVLMDIQMPELDGIQATKQIRALPGLKSKIPIIALTAHALAGSRERYLAAGMDDYLSKPVEPTALLTKLLGVARKHEEPPQHGDTSPPVEAAAVEAFLADAGIEIQSLHRLEEVMNPQEVEDFIKSYLTELEMRVSRMCTSDDLQELAADGHALSGTSGNVGAMQISKLAGKLESLGNTGDLDAVRDIVKSLPPLANKVSIALARWLRDRPQYKPQ